VGIEPRLNHASLHGVPEACRAAERTFVFTKHTAIMKQIFFIMIFYVTSNIYKYLS